MSGVPVIAVSGPPGSGKTRLTAALATRLQTAAVIEMDRYEAATGRSPQEMAEWLAAGADYDALPLGRLAEDLARLKAGLPARPPDGGLVRPGRVVLFDTLLGRAHAASGRLIDRLVWIDAPLDLALARKLGGLAAAAAAGPPEEAAGFAGWLEAYLGHYAGFVRAAYLIQRERVMPGADLVLDGAEPPEAAAERLAGMLGPLAG